MPVTWHLQLAFQLLVSLLQVSSHFKKNNTKQSLMVGSGIAAGSAAAAIQSSIGAVAAGSAFAAAQSGHQNSNLLLKFIGKI